MARIPQDEIDRIKREISIVRLVEAHGVTLKPHGKDLVGPCPFHTDHSPSLVVSPEKNLFHCLGKCSVGGSVIDWVMRVHGVSVRHAIEILRSDQMPAAPQRVAKHGTVPKLPAPVDMSADDQALFKQVVGFYHSQLKESPEALAYLKIRGITSTAVVEKYQLGFANRTLGLRLPATNRKAGGEIRSRLQSLGVLRETGHEHFNGSLVIPLHDEKGDVVGMYGRKITAGLRSGTPDHLYLPGPHRGVFNVQALERYPEIILCEALIDALTFLDAGFPNVTAAYGINGFTADHWSALKKYKTKRVLIAYDRDDAGEKAAETLAPQLMAAGLECFRIQFPRGMDANEYALKVTPPAKSLGVVIRNATWMGKGRAPDRDGPVAVVATGPTVLDDVADLILNGPPVEEDQDASAAGREILAALDAEEASRTVVAAALGHVGPVPDVASVAPKSPVGAPEPIPPPAQPRPVVAPLRAIAPVIVAVPRPDVAPPPASPVPPGPPPEVPIEHKGKDIWITLGDRQYRIRGLVNVGPLKVDVMVLLGERFHQDKFDFSLAKHRAAYVNEAARELGVSDDVVKKDLGVILRTLEGLQGKAATEALEKKKATVKLTPTDQDAALELLRDPRLINRILDDFRACGVVGEETNLLVGYLAMVSRKLERPMAVVIQSSTAAGKSSLMEALLSFLPKEEQLKYSAMTGQSLFYMGEVDLKHKTLAIAEEEGAERASYALKLLQSEGELTIASTGKDPATGRHVTHEYHVEGPVMIILTTTAVDIDEELLNRCVVLSVNENRDQTRVIHQMQREGQTLEGQLARRGGGRTRTQHQNAQRLLRPLMVVNPYARRLTFRDDQTRTRRDHGKYLTLMSSIALLHQYQRPVRSVDDRGERIEYVAVTRDDIRLANRLANEVLGRTLDELAPQTRHVLTRLDAWVRGQCEQQQMLREEFRFQRRELRALTGLSETRAREHLERLVDLEYVLVHRGTRGQSFVYELLYDGQGQDGQSFLMGLIDPDTLEDHREYDEKFAGSATEFAASNSEFAPSSLPRFTPIAAPSPGGPSTPAPAVDQGFGNGSSKRAENAVLEGSRKIVPYPQMRVGDGVAPGGVE